MKKKVLGLALVAMSLAAFSGMAQNTTSTTGTACIEKTKCAKTDKCNRAAKANPYDGLTLTDSQKAQLQQLDARTRSDRQQEARVRKEARQKNDSMRMADRKASRKSYLEQVKAIVGPDQYVVFLENMYVNGGGQHGPKAASFHKQKSKKGQMHRGGKGDRGQRSAVTKTAQASTSASTSAGTL